MAAKGMALAEFLVKIGFNTAQINKQLDAIEKRLDGILKKRRTVTGQALKDEKALLGIKKQELDVATKESRLTATRARTAAAEARARLTTARATERVARASSRAELLVGPQHPGRSYLNRRAREERQAAKEQALQGPPRPPVSRGGSRGGNAQGLAERRELLRLQAETVFRGGKINQRQFDRIGGMINSSTDLRSLGLARGHLAQAAREAARLRKELNLGNVASQRLASSTRQMMGNYVSLFAIAGGAGMAGRSSMQVESARAQLYGANFGDQGAANADYDFFRQMSLQYGTGMAESIKSFSGFKYAGGDIMDTAQMRELFQSVTLSGVAGGATQADMDRSFYALKQMASKGKISSEELNLQLAEANPLAKLGIEKAFEEFTGRDRSEMMDMMKRGEVYAKDILPLVAKHLTEISAKGVAAGMKTASKQLDIMRASAVDFSAAFGEAGGNEGLAEIYKAMSRSLRALTPVIKTVGAIFKWIGKTLAGVMNIFSGATESIAVLSEQISGQGGLLHGLSALFILFKTKIAPIFATALVPAMKRFGMMLLLPFAKLLGIALLLEEIANWMLPDDHPMKKVGIFSAPTGYHSGVNQFIEGNTEEGSWARAYANFQVSLLSAVAKHKMSSPITDGIKSVFSIQNMTVVANNPEEFGTQMDAVAAGMSR